MSMDKDCLKCSQTFDWEEGECPECGWDQEEWVEGGRYGLGKGGN